MDNILGMTGLQWTLCLLTLGVCGLLIVVILLQRGRGGGLAAAFGGGGGGSAFGAKTGDVFTIITVGLAAVFLFLNVVGNFAFDQTPTSQPDSTADTTLPAVATDTVPAEGVGANVTLQGTNESGEPIEIKIDNPFGSGEKAQPAAEGDSPKDSGSESPKAADQPDAKTDDSGTNTEKPGAGGVSGGGSNKG